MNFGAHSEGRKLFFYFAPPFKVDRVKLLVLLWGFGPVLKYSGLKSPKTISKEIFIPDLKDGAMRRNNK